MQVVTPLDEALVETQRRVSGVGVSEGESRWDLAHQEWETGWVRLTPHLADGELEERYRVVGTILTELRLREDADDGLHAGSPVMIVMRAIGNARIALAYWLRGDALPRLRSRPQRRRSFCSDRATRSRLPPTRRCGHGWRSMSGHPGAPRRQTHPHRGGRGHAATAGSAAADATGRRALASRSYRTKPQAEPLHGASGCGRSLALAAST
jgi:hypothetical protein